MSSCAIITFENGVTHDEIEYANSWRGSAWIWGVLFDKYLKDPRREYDSWLNRCDDLWPIWKRDDMPDFERAVLLSTYDKAIIYRENYLKFVRHLREFVESHPAAHPVHLTEWAKYIEHCDSEAIGFMGTSVTGSLFTDWDQEKDEPIYYNLNTGDEHFEVYESIESLHSGAIAE